MLKEKLIKLCSNKMARIVIAVLIHTILLTNVFAFII